MKVLILFLIAAFIIPSAKAQYKLHGLNDSTQSSPPRTKLVLKPNVQVDDIIGQFVGGNLAGALGGIGGAIVGAGISRVGGSHGEYAGLGGAVIGFVVGHCAGSIMGVYGFGSAKEVSGDLAYTILGGVAGTGTGLALLRTGDETIMWSTLTLPTVGAMVGFNSTLYYKDKKNVSELKDLGTHFKIKNDFEVQVLKVNFQLPKESEISKIPERFLLSLK